MAPILRGLARALILCVLLSSSPAFARYTSKTVLANGSYPTAAPSSLSNNAQATDSARVNVDVAITVTAGSGTISLLGYEPASAKWWPIGDIDVDVTSYAVGGVGYNLARFTPGNRFSHYALWVKTAGATVGTAYIGVDVAR